MPTADLVIRNARAATMTGPQAAGGEEPLGVVEGTTIACAGGRIVSVGAAAEGSVELDAGGALVTPGLVDPHTHVLFAGDRSHEYAARLAGATYLEIAAQGGGIGSTVRSTRAASDEELLAGARRRLLRMSRSGVTTVEVKSGYGLTVAEELRLLRLARALGSDACEVLPTLLGLHATPPGGDRERWVREVVEELTPEAARLGLAHGCDAFMEKGAFGADEVRAALGAGLRAGLVGHLHADQLSEGGGAQVAAELGCASADHLERAGPGAAAAMAEAGVTAVLLPLAAFFLRDKAAQAAPFLAAGGNVALGSNLNPGTQPMESVSLLLAAGCLLAGLTPAQALWACTAGGARALRLADRGRIEVGLRADLVLFDARTPAHLAAHVGVEHARVVIRGGRVVQDLRAERAGECAGK